MTNTISSKRVEPSLLFSYNVFKGNSPAVLELWGHQERISKGVVKDLSGKQIGEISPASIFGGNNRSISGPFLVAYLKTTQMSAVLDIQGKDEVAWLIPSLDVSSSYSAAEAEGDDYFREVRIDFEEEKVSLQKFLPSAFLDYVQQNSKTKGKLDEIGAEFFENGEQADQNFRFSDSIVWFTKALYVYLTLDNKKNVGVCYGNLGFAFDSLGDYQRSIEYHKKALHVAKEIKDRANTGTAYGSLGNAYYSLGEYREAIACHGKSLMIAKAAEDREDEGRTYGNLGNAHQALGEYRKAIVFHLRHLEITIELGDFAEEGAVYGNLGCVHYSLGEYQKAIECHKKRLQAAKKTEDRAGEGRAYGNLGNAYLSLGDFPKAVEYHKKDLEIAKEMEGLSGEGEAYGNLGSTYYCFGEYRKAIECYERALQIAKEIGDQKSEGSACGGLGNTYHDLGEYFKAIEYHEKRLEIAKKIENRVGEGRTYGNLGKVYSALGAYHQAIEYHEKCLRIMKEIEDRAGEVYAYAGLGNACLALGDYRTAIEHHEKCLRISKEIKDRVNEGKIYGDLGCTYFLLGEYQKAIELHERSQEIADEVGGRENKAQAGHNLGLSLFEQKNYSKSEKLLNQSIAGFLEVEASLDRDDWKISTFEQQSKTYRILQRNYFAVGEVDRALEVCERSRARSLFNLFCSRLGISQEAWKERDNISLETMQRIAKNEKAVFTYFSVSLDNDVHVWVVRADGIQSKRIELSEGFRTDVLSLLREDNSCRSLMASYLPNRVDFSSLGDESKQPSVIEKQDPNVSLLEGLEKCYQILITPIEDWLDAKRMIIIVDAAMRDVPFAALYKNGSSGKEYLIDKYTVSMVPSMRVFDILHELETVKNGLALIVADPAICENRLPGAKTEGEALVKKIPSPKLLNGEVATVEAVKEAACNASILHFACHGSGDARINRDSVFEGALCFTDGSGCKEMLYADEIQKLDLKADLVFLSACQTGKGALRREGVIGLSRAFLGAGVPSVIATHWNISDYITQEIVLDFYTNFLEDKIPKAEALRRAMLKQRRAYPDKPYLWGAFFLVGK